MVLDATHGAEEGVRNLTQAAMHAGATKEEIAEALRVAYFIAYQINTGSSVEAV